MEPQAAAPGASPGPRRGGARPAGSPPAAVVGDGRGKASPQTQPRRPSARVVRTPVGAAGGAKENGRVASGKGDDSGIDGGVGRYIDHAFQRVQNMRGVVIGGGDAGGAAQPPRRSSPEPEPEPGRRAREEGGDVGVVVGTDEAARNREASDLARRRRAARAVFGIGFGDQQEGEQPSVPRVGDKKVMLLKVSATSTLACCGTTVERGVAGRPAPYKNGY